MRHVLEDIMPVTGHLAESKGQKNLALVLGDVEIYSAVVIHCESCLEVQLSKRDRARLSIQHNMQGGCVKHVVIGLEPGAIGKYENRLREGL